MLPNRGRCHGVFLLAHAARLRERRGVDEWLQAARERSTYMAQALDLDRIASGLIRLGFVSFESRVLFDEKLAELSNQANRTTLMAIARILLLKAPPTWLSLAVNKGRVAREYIPMEDLEDLRWIEPELDQLLIDIHTSTSAPEHEAFRKRIGDAAELFIIAGLKMAGANPVHVSKLSDAYGYDIECSGESIDRIEVKAASSNTQDCFHISRNEFDKSIFYGRGWRLVQVIFSSRAFIADRLDASHVVEVRELRYGALEKFALPDTETFRWTESALITAPQEAWHSTNISLDPDFVTIGFRDQPRIFTPDVSELHHRDDRGYQCG